MTDLRTLLQQSAPAPRRALDVGELQRRAAQPPTRRWLMWLAGLGAVLGLAGPVGIGVLSPADGGDSRLGVGPVISSSTTTSTTIADGAVGGRTSSSSTTTTTTFRTAPTRLATAPAPATAPGETPGSGASPSVADTGAAPSTAASSPADYPAASACAVDDVDLAPGEQRRCRFTATTDGGASLRTTGPANPAPGARGEVFVTHDGTTTRYEVQYQSVRAGELGVFRCGKFIEPGDLVEVVLTNSMTPPDGERTTLGAGKGWTCWEG